MRIDRAARFTCGLTVYSGICNYLLNAAGLLNSTIAIAFTVGVAGGSIATLILKD